MRKKVVTVLMTMALSLSMLVTPNLTTHAAEGDVTFNGEVINISEATELTNNYGTGYLLSDGSTLVVTEYNSGADVSGYPWYSNKTDITKVIVADSVTVIDGSCFNNFSNITDVDFNKNMTEISSGFAGCTGITELDLPESLVKLSDFQGCTGLTELEVPASVTYLGTSGGHAFKNCTSLSRVILHDGIKELYAFDNCTGLTSITIPDSVTNLGKFEDCTGLTSITIPDSVTSIFRNTFKNCSNLTEIIGGNSLTSIGSNSFVGIADDVTLTTSNINLINHIGNVNTGINLKVIEADVERPIGTKTLAVTGNVDTRVVTLDVTIPVGGIQFSIDGDGVLTSQGVVIKSNTTVPLTVNVLSAASDESGVTIESGTTTLKAPKLVPVDFYTPEQWDNLGEYGTQNNIALAIKQVDVLDDGLGNLSAGEELTEATTDDVKVTTPVELGNITANNKLAHILSGAQTEQSIAINVEKDKAFTNYGKEWINADGNIFNYQITLEFAY